MGTGYCIYIGLFCIKIFKLEYTCSVLSKIWGWLAAEYVQSSTLPPLLVETMYSWQEKSQPLKDHEGKKGESGIGRLWKRWTGGGYY